MFMYLHLRTDKDGKVHALVQNNGALKFSSLGGPHSQFSSGPDHPFAVFRIEGFDGLESIDEQELLDEVFRRFTTKELHDRLAFDLTDLELIATLQRRLNRKDL